MASEPSLTTPTAPTQTFHISHLNEADFKPRGLRSYCAYRDLGVSAATHGLAQAHVLRMTTSLSPEWSERHPDDCELLDVILPAAHETVVDRGADR